MGEGEGFPEEVTLDVYDQGSTGICLLENGLGR